MYKLLWSDLVIKYRSQTIAKTVYKNCEIVCWINCHSFKSVVVCDACRFTSLISVTCTSLLSWIVRHCLSVWRSSRKWLYQSAGYPCSRSLTYTPTPCRPSVQPTYTRAGQIKTQTASPSLIANYRITKAIKHSRLL